MSLWILEWLNVFVQILLASIFLVSVVKLKRSSGITILILTTIQLFAYLGTVFLKNIIVLKVPVMFALIIGGILYVSKDNKKTSMLLSFAFLVIRIFSEALSLILYNFLTKFHYFPLQKIYELEAAKIVCNTIFSLIFLGGSMIFVVFWKKIKGMIRYKLVGFLVIFPLSQILLLSGVYYQNPAEISDSTLFYGTVCLVTAIIADYLMYKNISQTTKYIEEEQEFEFAKLQRKLQFEYYQLASENAEEAAALKHEINNHLQLAYALFSQKDKNKVKAMQLVEEIEKKVNVLNKIVYCGNSIINTILAIKTAEANSFGIETDIQIGSIENIVIADIDLCSIFSNLYDNAIEACKKYQNKNKRIIIKAGERSGYLVIKVSNFCAEDIQVNQDGYIATSKKNKKEHGYGLKLIRAIAQKYDGATNISLEDGVFEVVVSLKINLKIY